MGYSHYFEFNTSNQNFDKIRKQFVKVTREIRRLYNNVRKKVVIRGGDGIGLPIINESSVWFNGDSKKEEDAETFLIDLFNLKGEPRFETRSLPRSTRFESVKTNEAPYDLLVCLSLLAFSNGFSSNEFSFDTDGDMEQWNDIIKLYQSITKKTVRKDIINKIMKN